MSAPALSYPRAADRVRWKCSCGERGPLVRMDGEATAGGAEHVCAAVWDAGENDALDCGPHRVVGIYAGPA